MQSEFVCRGHHQAGLSVLSSSQRVMHSRFEETTTTAAHVQGDGYTSLPPFQVCRKALGQVLIFQCLLGDEMQLSEHTHKSGRKSWTRLSPIPLRHASSSCFIQRIRARRYNLLQDCLLARPPVCVRQFGHTNHALLAEESLVDVRGQRMRSERKDVRRKTVVGWWKMDDG